MKMKSLSRMCHRVFSNQFPLFLAIIICLCFSQAFTESSQPGDGSETSEGSSNSTNSNTTSGMDMEMNNNNKSDGNGGSNAGVIAGVMVPIILLAIIAIVVFIVYKKRSRMMDNEKKMKIQMTSARNAGVYQDLTVNAPTDTEKPPPSPEHERLQSAEEV